MTNNTCPACKSTDTKDASIRESNGILGDGAASWVIEEKFICNDCGVYFKPVVKSVELPMMSTNNTQLPVEVVKEIKEKAIDYASGIIFNSAWMNAEKIAEKRTEASVDYQAGATEWAQWKVKYDEERKERVHLDKENDLLKSNYQQLKERAQKMEAALKEILKQGDYYSVIELADKALAGKEVMPVKEIEYMPIHPDDAQKFDCPTQFPMHLLDEGQAQRNHSQTLKRLKERGGLSVREILAIVGKKNWSYYGKLPWAEAIKMLNEIVINNPH